MFYRWYLDSFDFFTGDATSNWVAVSRDTNEVVDTVLTPEYLEFCTLMAKWADLGYVSEADVASKIEAYQAALDAADYQKVLAEFRNQYNTFKAN